MVAMYYELGEGGKGKCSNRFYFGGIYKKKKKKNQAN